jgi:hypothetical protein
LEVDFSLGGVDGGRVVLGRVDRHGRGLGVLFGHGSP